MKKSIKRLIIVGSIIIIILSLVIYRQWLIKKYSPINVVVNYLGIHQDDVDMISSTEYIYDKYLVLFYIPNDTPDETESILLLMVMKKRVWGWERCSTSRVVGFAGLKTIDLGHSVAVYDEGINVVYGYTLNDEIVRAEVLLADKKITSIPLIKRAFVFTFEDYHDPLLLNVPEKIVFYNSNGKAVKTICYEQDIREYGEWKLSQD